VLVPRVLAFAPLRADEISYDSWLMAPSDRETVAS
jgi:hypothetical protein